MNVRKNFSAIPRYTYNTSFCQRCNHSLEASSYVLLSREKFLLLCHVYREIFGLELKDLLFLAIFLAVRNDVHMS